jgi:hypothetical protein|tara:strand:+ start:175 stop:276 length:102 start_codon:yes stop_codon:yes gene_type:complete
MKIFKSLLSDAACAMFIVGVIAGPFYAYIMGWV